MLGEVFTTRKSGRTIKTKGLIRIIKGQVGDELVLELRCSVGANQSKCEAKKKGLVDKNEPKKISALQSRSHFPCSRDVSASCLPGSHFVPCKQPIQDRKGCRLEHQKTEEYMAVSQRSTLSISTWPLSRFGRKLNCRPERRHPHIRYFGISQDIT